jgi:hypothetical protein
MKKNPMHVMRADARKILAGIAERTFAKLEAQGTLSAFRKGRGRLPSIYDLAVIVPQYITYTRTTVPSAGDKEARARRDRSLADLNELRLAQIKKTLLPRDQVVREGKTFVIAVRAKLLALPRRMVQLAIIPVEKGPEVATLIRETLEEMSRWDEKIAELEGAKIAEGGIE